MLESSNVVEVVERVVVKGLVKVSDYLPVLRMRCGFLAWFLGVVSWRGFLAWFLGVLSWWLRGVVCCPKGRVFPTNNWVGGCLSTAINCYC